MPDKKIVVWKEMPGHPADQFVLGGSVKIDHDVAAKNSVKLVSERKVLIHEIEAFEQNHPLQSIVDDPSVRFQLFQIPSERGRDQPHPLVRVFSFLGMLQSRH